MNSLDQLRSQSPSAILFECIAGSRAYGTTTSGSDEDIRGIFAVNAAAYLELSRPPDLLSDEKGNVVFFSLRRVIELLAQANPNILELLFTPADCVLQSTAEMQMLVAQRQVFISKQCADTHAGYAMSQIKKAKGQNKWINNPRPTEPPAKEDYCYVIPWQASSDPKQPPSRPIPLGPIGWPLNEYHAARLEHARDMFRLYHYGSGARGVFRGDALVCESIPAADESTRFSGLLIYNEQGWKQALVDHQNYWAWRRDRNEGRWRQQEAGELDFDAKNMMHTVRLLLSGRALMETGQPIVRFSGEQLALLMSIREGKLSFDEVTAIAQAILADCERLKETADLPDVCDPTRASAVLKSITDAWKQRQS
jgi:predicted nucleotidyltransferase